MGKAKYQLLRSEWNRPGIRILKEVPVADIRRGLALHAGMTRSQWLDLVGAEVDKVRRQTFDRHGRIVMSSIWEKEGMVRDTMRAADWLYQERQAPVRLIETIGGHELLGA